MQLPHWGAIRSILHDGYSFSGIKRLAGFAGFDMGRLAHLEQKATGGATKSQLLSALDKEFDDYLEDAQKQIVAILCERMAKEKPDSHDALAKALQPLGWQLVENRIVPLAIFDMADLVELPNTAAQDLRKGAVRLRDGDLSGAIASACSAIDAITEQIYLEHGLGKPGIAAFQEKVKKSLLAVAFKETTRAELKALGWDEGSTKMLVEI